MTDTKRAADDVAADPASELGLRNPVRDKARLGDSQYSVTPPRKEVRSPPAEACAECSVDLPNAPALRSDGEEYAYHFCSEACQQRWHAHRGSSDDDDPRRPRS